MEYNIILEGCNCVGKTSIFEELMHRGLLGERMIGIQHKDKMPPKTYEEGKELNEMLLKESNENKGIVFDRHIFSERVYAPILRKYIPVYIDYLERKLKKHNILFLIRSTIVSAKLGFSPIYWGLDKFKIPIYGVRNAIGGK